MQPRRLGWQLGDALEAQVEHRSALDGEPTGRHWSHGLIGQALENSYVAYMIVILAVAALSVHRANSPARPLVRSAWGRSVDSGPTRPASLGATGTQAALT